jgi:hypothetical protein
LKNGKTYIKVHDEANQLCREAVSLENEVKVLGNILDRLNKIYLKDLYGEGVISGGIF